MINIFFYLKLVKSLTAISPDGKGRCSRRGNMPGYIKLIKLIHLITLNYLVGFLRQAEY